MADDLLTPEERKAAVEVFGEDVVRESQLADRDPLRTCPTCEGRGGGCVDCQGTGCEKVESEQAFFSEVIS